MTFGADAITYDLYGVEPAAAHTVGALPLILILTETNFIGEGIKLPLPNLNMTIGGNTGKRKVG